MKYGNSSNAMWGMFTYDEQTLQLSSLEYSDLLKLEYGYSQGGGNNGQIAEIKNVFEPAASQQFTYDALHRLKTAAMGTINPSTGTIDAPQWGLEWDYDRYGNRELQQGTAGEPPEYAFSVSDTSNQTSSVTDVDEEVTTVGHDAAGNVIEQETTTSTDTYVFDAESRLLSAAVAGRPTQTFLYDATGLRTMKTVDGEPSASTAFVSVGAQVLAECAADDVEYLFFGGRPVAVYDAATQALAYLHYDHLSLHLVTDANGDLVSENWHYPYGEQGAGDYTGANLFTSYERDDEEFDYAKFRYFAPHHGRFRSVDPLHGSSGNPQSLNRYAYAQNDPINLIDPLGLAAVHRSPEPYDGRSGGGSGDLPWDADLSTLQYGLFGVTFTLIGAPSAPAYVCWGAGTGTQDDPATTTCKLVWVRPTNVAGGGLVGAGGGLLYATAFENNPTRGGQARFGTSNPASRYGWDRTFHFDFDQRYGYHFNAEIGPLKGFNHNPIPKSLYPLGGTSVLRGLGKASVVGGLAFDAYDLATTDPGGYGRAVGGIAGGWGGALGGAAIGSLIAPGPGTVIGAFLGGVFGSAGGQYVGDRF